MWLELRPMVHSVVIELSCIPGLSLTLHIARIMLHRGSARSVGVLLYG